MPVDTRINVPFIPSEGVTSQILQAITLANEQFNQSKQRQIQQQQLTQQAPLQEAQAAEAKARSGYYGTEAAKNQLQVDAMRKAQEMFNAPQGTQGAQAPPMPQPQGQATGSGAAPGPNLQQQTQMYPGSDLAQAESGATGSGAIAGPNLQQQTQMYPGSDLAKAEGATPKAEKWLPSGTPPQIAPLISAMIPDNLNDQEKNVIEAGAQTGRIKAMQSGDLPGYFGDVRSAVDAVVTNRNRNVENQPLSDGDRSNFTKNILPSFENLSPAQKKGAAGELASVKDQKGLQQLEGRLMQQDNQALQKTIAQKNIEANRAATHENALDLAGRNKIVADTNKWTDSSRQIASTLNTLDAAKSGDDLATRLVPTAEVLGINMAGGIKRISPGEYDAARVPVSWVNRFNQWVGNVTEGKTTPEMVNEGKRLMHDLADTQYTSYLAQVNSTANTFGKIDPSSIYVVNKKGEVSSLSDANKGVPGAARAAKGGPSVIIVRPEEM